MVMLAALGTQELLIMEAVAAELLKQVEITMLPQDLLRVEMGKPSQPTLRLKLVFLRLLL